MTDDGIDAHLEFGEMQRFAEIIVGANLQTAHLIVERILSRHDDDAHRVLAATNLSKNVESIAARQHLGDHHAFVVVYANFHLGIGEVEGLLTKLFLRTEIAHDAIRQFLLVFNNQNFHNTHS